MVFIAAMIVVNEYANRLNPLKNNTQQLNRSIWEKIGWDFPFFPSVLHLYKVNIIHDKMSKISERFILHQQQTIGLCRCSHSIYVFQIYALSDRIMVLRCHYFWQCMHQYLNFILGDSQIRTNHKFA